ALQNLCFRSLGRKPPRARAGECTTTATTGAHTRLVHLALATSDQVLPRIPFAAISFCLLRLPFRGGQLYLSLILYIKRPPYCQPQLIAWKSLLTSYPPSEIEML